MMRCVAKNIVAARLAARCEVQVVYCIGDTDAFSLKIDTFGTGTMPDTDLADIARKCFGLSPEGIIRTLDLRRPIYTPLSAYGHFGREGVPWECMGKVDELRKAAKLTQ
jgi:S-adenosylmethionine synthetase